ncbi:HNH endonuclease [Spirosoma sp. KUDC1026]|nr:HNH endonuclease [Spirosoma sp. KUDC1026]
MFSTLLNAGKISFGDGNDLITVLDRLIPKRHFWLIKDDSDTKNPFWLTSSEHYFPVTNQRVIDNLVQSFLFLFPILDACYDLAEGAIPILPTHFKNLKIWLNEESTKEVENIAAEVSTLQLPDLDSYKFIRAGLWYQVLARDNWTCCSCRRSAKEHGIVLHVDHIIPRSKGGKDEFNNLQTLCLKCNIGKSNKDITDLR